MQATKKLSDWNLEIEDSVESTTAKRSGSTKRKQKSQWSSEHPREITVTESEFLFIGD